MWWLHSPCALLFSIVSLDWHQNGLVFWETVTGRTHKPVVSKSVHSSWVDSDKWQIFPLTFHMSFVILLCMQSTEYLKFWPLRPDSVDFLLFRFSVFFLLFVLCFRTWIKHLWLSRVPRSKEGPVDKAFILSSWSLRVHTLGHSSVRERKGGKG